ncbi:MULTISPECIES: phage gp6-like head-tail connector protein [Bacillus cereus group]|uniref:Phage gp6-like head-tail connector protein n=1 Tax=Bacillus proteolyticus TaxID=2026192 RepID=A0ABV3I8W5_9BACI|nr:phage gp6-like head-tail connector protein [Bacillus cereus group sp. N8]MBJ8103592.1 phage gp6-like head-tail connector protein [Bacillus cereus group sp. N8]
MEYSLVNTLKEHIHWEEGMSETMLPFYIKQGQRYVQNATGKQEEYMVIMCAAIFYEYRVSEKELIQALDAITPFIIQEQYNAKETDK